MLKVYIDDSGKRDQSTVHVLAGYMAPADKWVAFTSEWISILSDHHVDAFRMADAWRLQRKYQKNGALARDSLIVRLAHCINRHVSFAFVSVLPYQSYDKWIAVPDIQARRPLRPYFFAFYAMLSQIHLFKKNSQIPGQLEVIFDEQGGESQEFVLSALGEFEAASVDESPFASVPLFRSDRDEIPLQAADMLAWLVRRDTFNRDKERDRSQLPESVLLRHVLSIPHYAHYWDERSLESASKHLLGALLSVRETGRLPSLGIVR